MLELFCINFVLEPIGVSRKLGLGSLKQMDIVGGDISIAQEIRNFNNFITAALLLWFTYDIKIMYIFKKCNTSWILLMSVRQ